MNRSGKRYVKLYAERFMSSHNFDEKQWAKLDVFNQMGNIGSEVGRALAAQRQGKNERMMSAFYRGIDLINATVRAWSESKYVAVPELLAARELFAEAILGGKPDAGLESYFMQFAIAARMRQLA